MNRRVRHILPLVLLAAAAVSCVKRPEGVRSDGDMAPVIADLEIAEAYMRSEPGNMSKSRDGMLEYVLRKHGISREDYDTTMSWYGRNPDKYYVFCDKVEKELQRRKRKIGGHENTETAGTDLWPYSRMTVFSPMSVSDGIDFSIPTADVKKGDRLKLRMRFSSPVNGNAMLGVEYDGGAKGYVFSQTRGDHLEMDFQSDTALAVKRIFGNVTLSDDTRLPLWGDSISLGTLPYDSMEYHRIHTQRMWREPVKRRAVPKPVQPGPDIETEL